MPRLDHVQCPRTVELDHVFVHPSLCGFHIREDEEVAPPDRKIHDCGVYLTFALHGVRHIQQLADAAAPLQGALAHRPHETQTAASWACTVVNADGAGQLVVGAAFQAQLPPWRERVFVLVPRVLDEFPAGRQANHEPSDQLFLATYIHFLSFIFEKHRYLDEVTIGLQDFKLGARPALHDPRARQEGDKRALVAIAINRDIPDCRVHAARVRRGLAGV
mmetsp:Transcript_88986/g.272513  ORF Transcript_88986/g.272513 Transcript_88986/m.272513 type:complete len:219 (-) Transcript_88986:1919-2575(-)